MTPRTHPGPLVRGVCFAGFIHRDLTTPTRLGQPSDRPMMLSMLRPAAALLLALSCTAVEPASPATIAPAVDEAAILAAARSADFFYHNHMGRLQADLTSPELEVRLQALATLGRTQNSNVVALLLPILEASQRTPAEVIAACQAAGTLGIPGGVTLPLRSLLTHNDAQVRLAAYNALAVLAARNPGDTLIAANDANEVTNAAAKSDLGIIRHPEAGQILSKTLASDSRAHVRRMAAIGISRLNNKEFAPALQEALVDPDPQVRRHAANGLARLQYTAAIPFLLIALETNIAGTDIANALNILTGQDFGFKAGDTQLRRQEAIDRGFSWWTAHASELGG